MGTPQHVLLSHPQLGTFVFAVTPRGGALVRPHAGWSELSTRLSSVDLNTWAPLQNHPLIPSEATLLTHAVDVDDLELVDLLLKAGALPDRNTLGEARSEPIARRLVVAGAPVGPNELGRTPLHSATSPEVIRFLLEAGCDPLHADENGSTPVMTARGSRMSREAFQLLRNAAAARATALPGRGVRFKRSKVLGSNVRAFVEARLKAASHLDWSIVCIPAPLGPATDALAKALGGKVFGLKTEIPRRIERDVPRGRS